MREDKATRLARLKACEDAPNPRDGSKAWLGALIATVCAVATLAVIVYFVRSSS